MRRPGRDRRREREPGEHRDGDGEDPERRVDRSEGRDRRQVERGGRQHPERDEGLVADEHVSDAQRGREHGVVLAVPFDRREHRPARLEGRELHPRGGEEARGDELEVAHSVRQVGRPVHELAEPEAEGEQVEHGVTALEIAVPRQTRRYWAKKNSGKGRSGSE